jgi:hypothetical protein
LVQFSSPGVGAGSFYLAVNDLTVGIGTTNTLMGSVTGGVFNHAPEPSSIFLLSTVVGGLAFAMRRKLQAR